MPISRVESTAVAGGVELCCGSGVLHVHEDKPMRLAGALPNTATQWQADLSGQAPLSP